MRNCKIVGSRDYGRAGAGEEVWGKPALVACHCASRWICANEPEIRFHAHELVFDGYLQTFHAGRANGPLHLGQNMLKDALVNGLLHDLKDAVLHDKVASDKARTRRYDFRDESFGPKGISDQVTGSIHHGTANHGKCSEQDGVTVPNVGKCNWIIVAPGRESHWHFHGRCDGGNAGACHATHECIAEESFRFARFVVILGWI